MVALAMSCAVAAHTIAQTPAPQEYQVKAVYLFNFTQFVDWPPSTFSNAQEPIVIGVLGEKVDNRSLVVRRYRRAEDIQACQVLFISRSEGMRIEHIVATLKDRSILTVSDADDFGQRGGMVRFVVDNSRIKLRINVAAAKAAGLTISSKLLRVAEIVTSDEASR